MRSNSKLKDLDVGTCLVGSQKATSELQKGEQGARDLRTDGTGNLTAQGNVLQVRFSDQQHQHH